MQILVVGVFYFCFLFFLHFQMIESREAHALERCGVSNVKEASIYTVVSVVYPAYLKISCLMFDLGPKMW